MTRTPIRYAPRHISPKAVLWMKARLETGSDWQILLIEALPPQLFLVYALTGKYPEITTNQLIAELPGLLPNHASNLLNELWRYNLVERTERRDNTGKYYVYRRVSERGTRNHAGSLV